MWSTTYESKSIFCRSIRQAQSNRTAESTQIQKSLKSAVPNWFIRRNLHVPNLTIRFGTCKVRRYITHSWRELGRPVHQLTDSSTPYAFSCANNKLRKMESNTFDKSIAIETSFLLLIERFRGTFTLNFKREFVAHDQVSSLIVVYCLFSTNK